MPGGRLLSADLAADIHSSDYEGLLRIWMRMLQAADVPEENLQRLRQVYGRDVAVEPPALIEEAGFATVMQLFQGGLIHAWSASKAEGGKPVHG